MSRPHWPLGMTRRPTPSYSDQALAVAREIDDPAYRAWPLGQVAAALATAGVKTKDVKLLDQAVAVAQKIGEPADSATALSQVATALAAWGDKTKVARLLDQAVTVAEKVSDPTSKVIVLSQVATVTQGPPGLLDQAVAVAQGIEPLAYLGHNIADILIQIAAALAAAGDTPKVPGLLDDAVAAAGVQETADPRCAQTVGDIARTLAAGVVRVKDFKFLDRVVALAQEIDVLGLRMDVRMSTSWARS